MSLKPTDETAHKYRTTDTGLSLSHQNSANTAARVTLDGRPTSEVWQAVAESDGFAQALVDAVRDLLATPRPAHHSQRADRLREHGVTAAENLYADIAAGLDRLPEDRRHQAALELTAQFGSGSNSLVGWPIGLDELTDGPLAVLAAADRSPTVTVRLTHEFREQRADQRRDLCRLLEDLATVCNVRVVGSGLLLRWLVSEHRTDLSVSREDIPGREEGPTGELVEQAREVLAHDGREVSILRTLADEETGATTYHALYAEAHVSKSRVRQCVGELADLGLVDTYDGSDGRRVELLSAGRQFIESYFCVTITRDIAVGVLKIEAGFSLLTAFYSSLND